jgi:hypothetical protein
MRKRIMMSESERKLLNANIELVRAQKIYLRDISRLISYIKGNINVKSEVEGIIKYYTKVLPGERVNEVEKWK